MYLGTPSPLPPPAIPAPLSASPIPLLRLTSHANCSRWVEERYRFCADLDEEEAENLDDVSHGYTVIFRNGSLTAHKTVSLQPQGSYEGVFLHLQRWKARLGEMAYGTEQMPRLRGPSISKLSLRGFAFLDVPYSDLHGADLEALHQEGLASEMDGLGSNW